MARAGLFAHGGALERVVGAWMARCAVVLLRQLAGARSILELELHCRLPLLHLRQLLPQLSHTTAGFRHRVSIHPTLGYRPQNALKPLQPAARQR